MDGFSSLQGDILRFDDAPPANANAKANANASKASTPSVVSTGKEVWIQIARASKRAAPDPLP
jgi:hypothetical protein